MDGKISLIIKPGKKVRKVIDDIEYIFTTNGNHFVKVYDKTNNKDYEFEGISVINLKIFEVRTISKFDSNRCSLHRSNDIELTII